MSSAKDGPPEARRGEGEAGRGEEGMTRAICWEAMANPSDEPAAMAMVTSGAGKSVAADSVPLTATSATVRSEP